MKHKKKGLNDVQTELRRSQILMHEVQRQFNSHKSAYLKDYLQIQLIIEQFCHQQKVTNNYSIMFVIEGAVVHWQEQEGSGCHG